MSCWSGPCEILKVLSYGIVELLSLNGVGFIVNGHLVKHLFEDSMHSDSVVECIKFVNVKE